MTKPLSKIGALLVAVSHGESSNHMPREDGNEVRPPRGPCERCENLLVGEDGKISILTIVVLLIFFVLIGFVLNSGTAVVEKIEVQNAADAAAYSSALWMARGMNAITTTNHLMGELTALVVLIDGFGGPAIEEPKATDESDEMSQFIQGLRRPATYAGTVAPLQTIDDELLGQIEEWFAPDDEDEKKHKVGATLYDAKMSLKYCAVISLATKAISETVRKFSYGLGPYQPIAEALVVVVHIGVDVIVVKLLQEWIVIYAIEQATLQLQQVNIKEPVKKVLGFLTMYADEIAGSRVDGRGVASSLSMTPLNRALEQMLSEFGKSNGVAELALYPHHTDLRLPVYPEPPPAESEEKYLSVPPSQYDASPLGGPFGELEALKKSITGFIQDANSFVESMNEAFPGLGLVKISNSWKQFSSLDSWNPTQIKKIYEPGKSDEDPPLAEYEDNEGYGYSENPSYVPMAEYDKLIDWKLERHSQWVRATYPQVDTLRAPVCGFFDRYCEISGAAHYFVNWTNRYTLSLSHEFRKPEDDSDDGQDQQEKDDEKDALALVEEVQEKLKKLRDAFREALEPSEDLAPGAASAKNDPLDQVVMQLEEFEKFVRNHSALDKLGDSGVDIYTWLDKVSDALGGSTNNRKWDKITKGITPQDDLNVEEDDYRGMMTAIARINILSELLEILEELLATIEAVTDLFRDQTPHMYLIKGFEPAHRLASADAEGQQPSEAGKGSQTQSKEGDIVPGNKGRESWTDNAIEAEKIFTVLAVARRETQPVMGQVWFSNPNDDGIICLAEAIYYNANGLDLAWPGKRDSRQPNTGWDTLNWQPSGSADNRPGVIAKEWSGAKPDKGNGSDLFKVFLGSVNAPRSSKIQLNWQAKLVPVGEVMTRAASSSGSLPEKVRKATERVSDKADLITH